MDHDTRCAGAKAGRTRFSQRRRQRFLQALAQGQSIASAARHAGISPATVRYWRGKDEQFDAACKQVLSDTRSMAPRVINPGGRGVRLALVPKRDTDISEDQKRIFLTQLAKTSHISASAKAAGISKSQIYRIRKSDPQFADAWQQALHDGYADLEMTLLHHARFGTPQAIVHGGKVTGEVRVHNAGHAMRLLQAHQQREAAGSTGDNGKDAVAELRDRLLAMRDRLLPEAPQLHDAHRDEHK